MQKKILVVDDDALLRRSLAFNLERNGYIVQTAANAENALEICRLSRPDLVILDIGLPGMDGLDALRILRNELGIAVILLTARRRELDEILGLELGADDYVSKPFDFDVLLAHIKAVLRRIFPAETSQEPPRPITLNGISIDPENRSVRQDGVAVSLAPREFDLLYALMSNAGKVLSTEDLLVQVWGAEFEGQPQVVYVHIRWLRQKLEDDPENPKLILTVRGYGYKFAASEETG